MTRHPEAPSRPRRPGKGYTPVWRNRNMLFDHGAVTGTLPQIFSAAAAVAPRNLLEDIHAGPFAAPSGRVHWPGGTCRYEEAARLTRNEVSELVAEMHSTIATDMADFCALARTKSEDVADRLRLRLLFTDRWVVPDTTAAAMAHAKAIARDAVWTPSGRVRDARGRWRRALEKTGWISRFFDPVTDGITSPAHAAGAGETVIVETEEGPVPWERVSHLDGRDMRAFNIGLCDHIHTLLLAIDRERDYGFWQETTPEVHLVL